MAINRTLEYGANFAKGVVYFDFSFAPNGAGQPLTTSFRGDGIASVTHVGGTNAYVVTLKDSIRYAIAKSVDLTDPAGVGRYASVGDVANEGTAVAATFTVYTWTNAGAALNDVATGRIACQGALKNSGIGS